MQPASRTPNSILRRRLDKENDDIAGKATKRVRGNRRVSFAPADELETKHIFKQDSRDDHASTDELNASPIGGLVVAGGVVNPLPPYGAQPDSSQLQGGGLAVLPSPVELSPLSMDLTNNSFDQQVPIASSVAPVAAAGGSLDAGGAALSPTHHHHHSHTHHEYTRNITLNVPNLSTLVEEDEEEYDGNTPAVDSSGADACMHAPSPISPFVLREMQRGGAGGEGNADLRNRWGFAPGAEDTMDVNFGRAVMGETTYNNVYGACTTGEITKAFKDTNPDGKHVGALKSAPSQGPTQPAAALEFCGAGPAGKPGPGDDANPSQARSRADGIQLQQQQFAPSQPQALQRQGPLRPPPPAALPQNTPFMDNTTKLLEDDQTDAWRLPGQSRGYDRGRLSVASNKVLVQGYRRGDPEAGGAGAAGAGDTTVLLGPTTQLLATGGAHTAQLLAETTNHKAAYDRFLRGMAGRQAEPSPAPPQRPGLGGGAGDATAISSSAAELLRAAAAAALAQDSTEMSMELQASHAGAHSDLLCDGGLSLDAFAMPPEPTVNLSQQLAVGGPVQLRGQRAVHGEVGRSPGNGLQLMRTSKALPAVAPPITCQDFLTLIEVGFNEKVCRTSYLPQSDPPPKTVAEVYEAAAVVAPYVETYQATVLEMSSRLANAQLRVQQLESELSASNPELFSAVQLMPGSQLEVVKDQFINLKKLCRIRTVKSIKQTHLRALDELLERLFKGRDTLQAELAAVAADVERLKQCVQDKTSLTTAISRWCQEDEGRMQEAIQLKKKAEGHLQRLESLRAQNAERRRQMDEARAERQKVQQHRVPLEVLQQQRKALEDKAAELAERCNSASTLTPGRETQMAKKVAAKRDEVEALLSLHALRLDISDMERTGSFKMLFRGTYQIECDTSGGSTCKLKVSLPDGVDKPCRWAPGVTASLGASAAALSCEVPTSELPMRFEAIQRQLNRMWRLAQQLESCWMKYNCMLRPAVEEGPGGGEMLLLEFQNVVTTTRVAIRMPWPSVLQSDSLAPSLQVQMKSLDPPQTQQECCNVLQASVLSKLAPSTGYIPALCYTMSETLQVPSGASQAANGASYGVAFLNHTPEAQPPEENLADQVFDNPLFTIAPV